MGISAFGINAFAKSAGNSKAIFAGNLSMLEKFRSYDDQISAVKMQYNNEQMQHIMDEAREVGEKIAKEAFMEEIEDEAIEELAKSYKHIDLLA